MNISKILLLSFLAYNVCFSQSNNLRYNEFSSKSIERIKTHLEYLGSDLFKGRGTGTTGGNLAAKYLAEEYSKYGLIPLGNQGTYYQYIPMHGSTALKSSDLLFGNSGAKDILQFGDDFLVIKSDENYFTNNYLETVFVGYGIIAGEFDYNDYLSVNVEGKIAVMFEGEPYSNDVNFFNAENETIYANLEAKQRIAMSRGAKGCVFIPNPNNNSLKWDALKQTYSFENISLAYSVSGNLSIIINPHKAAFLFKNSKYEFNELANLIKEKKIESFPLKTKFFFRGEFKRRDFLSPNIVGMIEGTDDELKDSYIVVSAHYDHLGIGITVKGDSIYNGVFDNAAGCAALLELAKKFSEPEEKPKCSIIFLLTTGEEFGLLGSGYYVSHPPIPLYKTFANVNIDGVASFDRFKSIVGIGAEYSTLSEILKLTAKGHNLSVSQIPEMFMTTEAYRSSDQISFAIAGVPAILISEGLEYENISYQEGLEKFIKYTTEIYHTPFDDLSQSINYSAFVQHMSVIKDFIINLSESGEEPKWNEGVIFNIERLRTKAEKR